MKQKFYILFLLLFTATINVSATQVYFKASVNNADIAVGDNIQITFSTNTSLNSFIPPSFDGFQVLQGPMQSYSEQNINGRRSTESSITYIIRAIKEGEITIGSAKAKAGNEELKTNPIKINVSKGNVNSARNQEEQQQMREAQKLKKSLFILVQVDKTSAYVGEKITARYTLYSKVNLANLAVNKTPDLNGFWSKDLKSLYDNKLNQKEVTYNGQRYTTLELRSTLLYPQRSGKLLIDPIELNAVYQVQSRRSNSFFDQVFGGNIENKKVLLKSNAVSINVKPLPADKPLDFNGAVGSFTANMVANKTDVKANEAINVKITIKGHGNLHLIPAPKLDQQPDIEIYDPKVSDNFKTNADGISGSREFDFLVIPRHEGTFTIPAYHFSYFDLKSKNYKTVKTEALKLNIAKGDSESITTYTPVNKEDVEILNNDIIHIKKSAGDLTKVSDNFFGSSLFYSLLLLPFVLFGAAVWYKSANDKLYSDKALLKKSKANKMATKRLSTAKNHLKKEDLVSFYQEMGTAVLNYFSDKFGIPISELSKEKITERLQQSAIDSETISSINILLDQAEMARYAPGSNLDAEDIYKKAIVLISKIDNQVK